MDEHQHHRHLRHNFAPSTSGTNGDMNSMDADMNMVVLDTPDRICKKPKSIMGANGDMDSIDFDRIMVIPDTPDRLCIKQKNNCQGSDASAHYNSRNARQADEAIFHRRFHGHGNDMRTLQIDPYPRGNFNDVRVNQRTGGPTAPSILRNAPASKTVADRNLKLKGRHQSNNQDAEDGKCSHARSLETSYHHSNNRVVPMFGRGDSAKVSKDVACLHPSAVSFKSTRNDDKGKYKVSNDFPRSDANSVKGNGKVCHVASEHGTEKGLSVPSHSPGGPHAIIKRRLVRNGLISPHNIAKAGTSAESSSVSSGHAKCDGMSVGSQNVIDVDNVIAKQDATSQSKGKGVLIHSPTLNGHHDRRLVRNGCASPQNIAKAKAPAESSSVSSAYVKCNGISIGSQNVIDADNVFAKQNAASRSKGKGVLIHSSPLKGHQDRERDNVFFADARLSDSCKSVNGKISSSSALSASELLPVLNGSKASTSSPSKRPKKPASSSSTPGDKREIICLSSGGESLAAKSTRNHHGRPQRALGSPIVVGDFSPEVRDCVPQSDDNDNETKAIQLQVDEMMARELQEQLYNEMPEATSSERVSEIAAIAAEARIGPASFRGRQHAHVNIGVRPPNTRRASQIPSLRNRLRRGAQARIPSSNVARLRARINRPSMVAAGRSGRLFPSDMDVDMRIELLEALEAVADEDIRMVNQLLHSDREFGEDDYEMLLALDENNHEHLGASVAHISNLPESTLLSETTEVCSICLDTPAVGDTMRHLPCFHKFHKDCIDTWLRRKRSCPVCKSDV
ncbi:hypothetical protein RND81_01G136300 [Saponaria officinalis]|uniref:RING-type domain-containing protein n=1 Tax=Saponaria officinalis TaxID=3572 RepID=A0AAW1NFH0_SAPOF